MSARLGFWRQRVGQVVSGALNFPAFVTAGIRTSVVAVLRAASQVPAFRVELAPATLLVDQKPALRITGAPADLLAATQRIAYRADAGVARLIAAEQRPAFDAGVFADSRLLLDEKPALNMVQVRYDLSHLSFVVTMTNDAANTVNWTNPANAQGTNDGTNATWGNPLLILAAGKMHGTTVAQVNRPASLIIDEVYVAAWGSWSGFPVLDDILTLGAVGYRIGGLPALDVQTRRQSGATGSWTAAEDRIDNGAGAFTDTLGTAVTWANIALLQLYASGNAVVGVNPSFNVDAMRLRVVAHETQVV